MEKQILVLISGHFLLCGLRRDWNDLFPVGRSETVRNVHLRSHVFHPAFDDRHKCCFGRCALFFCLFSTRNIRFFLFFRRFVNASDGQWSTTRIRLCAFFSSCFGPGSTTTSRAPCPALRRSSWRRSIATKPRSTSKWTNTCPTKWAILIPYITVFLDFKDLWKLILSFEKSFVSVENSFVSFENPFLSF